MSVVSEAVTRGGVALTCYRWGKCPHLFYKRYLLGIKLKKNLSVLTGLNQSGFTNLEFLQRLWVGADCFMTKSPYINIWGEKSHV